MQAHLTGTTTLLEAMFTSEDRVRLACNAYMYGWIDVDELESRLERALGLRREPPPRRRRWFR